MQELKNTQWMALIKDTILKELRSKTLIFIFIATTLMIFLAHALLKMFANSTDPNSAAPMLVNAASSLSYMFWTINIMSVIIAAVFGISAVRSDFREKIIYQYLTFPISRTQYMLGRIFGAWILVFSYYLYAYILSAILFSIATHSLALTWGHLGSILLMGVYLFIVIFISFIYSLFAGKISSFLLVLMTVLIISLSTESMRHLEYAEYFKNFSFFRLIGMVVYFIFPRINYITETANGLMFKEEMRLNLGLESLHLFATTIIFIFLADRLIKRKNF